MTSFAIWDGVDTWLEPTASAMPVGIGGPDIPWGPVVKRYPPEGRSGWGYPVGLNTELYAEVGRPRIDSAGLTWWYTTTGLLAQPYQQVYVRLWDPAVQNWVSYRGYMWAPQYGGGRAGYKMTQFVVRFTNLVQENPPA